MLIAWRSNVSVATRQLKSAKKSVASIDVVVKHVEVSDASVRIAKAYALILLAASQSDDPKDNNPSTNRQHHSA